MGQQVSGGIGLYCELCPSTSFFSHELNAIHNAYTGSNVWNLLEPQKRLALRLIRNLYASRFMDSLQWVDQTYAEKHKSEDASTLREMYYPNLRLYATYGEVKKRKRPQDAAYAFGMRFGKRAVISLAIYLLSYLPLVGRFVLPAASFYTLNKTLGPLPATFIFGSGIFLPRRYLVVFLQSYFSSRSLMRELVRLLNLILYPKC